MHSTPPAFGEMRIDFGLFNFAKNDQEMRRKDYWFEQKRREEERKRREEDNKRRQEEEQRRQLEQEYWRNDEEMKQILDKLVQHGSGFVHWVHFN